MSRPICVEEETKVEVDEILCDATSPPSPKIIECYLRECPDMYV